ncbi:MAG: glycosyltransferase [Pseudomonadota bacterium]
MAERLVIAALTYRRPEGLADLLAALARLSLGDIDASAVIVDNSPEAGARAQVGAAADTSPYPLAYLHQPQRGISFARNMALETALAADAHLMAFIDDDEIPPPDWILKMRAAMRTTGAEAVLGAVIPRFEAPPPGWIERSDMLAFRGCEPHGEMPYGTTSNVLFSLGPVRQAGLRFHPDFAFTGGEDVIFFDGFRRQGARIIYAPEGQVEETISPARARLGWLWARWRRTGNTDARVSMLRRRGLGTRGLIFAGGLARMVGGSVLAIAALPAWALYGFEHVARRLYTLARGIGYVEAAFGRSVEEYRVLSK